MSETKPRAFPSNAIDDQFGGMDLLSYFAGQALPGLVYNFPMMDNVPGMTGEEVLAAQSFVIADAMMAEREKRNGS